MYGGLVIRGAVSRQTLEDLVNIAGVKFFDVNLRYPHYSKEILLYLMTKADYVKFNGNEIREIVGFYGKEFKSLEVCILFIAEKTKTKNNCVTKGREGAILYYEEVFYYNEGFKVAVVDTVGAGDSFLLL